ncbi:MAG: septum formation protein Maf [Proteobacteria bacterium]|nr:septum formation protein Maf [Pseudomonadota bacterium]
MRNIVLASKSPRRIELLKREGLDFKITPSDINEERFYDDDATPEKNAMKIAVEKAKTVSPKYKDSFIIAADTMVVIGGKILGKPVNRDEARYMIQLLSGKVHRVITGFCVLYSETNEYVTSFSKTDVTFKPLSLKEIDEYLDKIEFLDKAGAYAIQDYGNTIIKKIEGNKDNVMGLPVKRVIEILNNFKPGVNRQC